MASTAPSSATASLAQADFIWALGAMCRLHRLPFDAARVLQQYPPPHNLNLLRDAASALGFAVRTRRAHPRQLKRLQLPCIVALKPAAEPAPGQPASPDIGLVIRAGDAGVEILQRERDSRTFSIRELARRCPGEVIEFRPADRVDDAGTTAARFGFGWFVPELLRQKGLWTRVAIASLALQLTALAVPLLTQVLIDKVVAHQTMNTLAAIAVALFVFVVLNAVVGWGRQYLLLHAGNRIDAVLGDRVFARVLGLPVRYFESRPTGTIVARLQGIETIRQFLTGAAVAVLLELPFLVVFAAAMLHYSAQLALVALALLACMTLVSLAVAPVIRRAIDRQFLVGARNQAFLTEYIAGMETVKALQLEPLLRRRYAGYLSSWLTAGYRTGQIHNGYSVAMNALEQLMLLCVLCLGAMEVMRNEGFTVGMLVAFQMFAARTAQPLLRLASLWQEFQQARVAVRRLADLMDAPVEPVSVFPGRTGADHARIEVEDLHFRHSERGHELFGGLGFTAQPGECVAVTGPSGAGKSTLVKLLQGIYMPERGRIRLSGHDVRSLPVNELRAMFGVVPQESVLFSGTVYENLVNGNPQAQFADVVHACRLAGIHDVIEALPDGYQTRLGEHGSGLSGGQKQRIAIARALLKRPRALLLDEPVSQLDDESAAAVMETIRQLRGRVTVIIVAHGVPGGITVDREVRLGGSSGGDR